MRTWTGTLRSRAAAILVVSSMLVPLTALPAHAADDATLTVSPTEVAGGSTNDFTFTFTSQNSSLAGAGSTLTLSIDKAFLPAPQTSDANDPGYLQAQNVNCQQGPTITSITGPSTKWLVAMTLQCNSGTSFTVTYNDVTAPSANTTPYTFDATLTGAQNGLTVTGSGPSVLVHDAHPPTLDSAVGGDGQVALAWTAPTAGGTVTGYQVQRSLTSGTGFTDLGAPLAASTLSTTDTPVTNGTTYYYRVRTVTAMASSAPSNELSATPRVAPNAPSMISATPGDSQVSLVWAAPTGGAPVTGYRLERSLAAGGPFTTAATLGNVTTTVDTGLTNGTTYWYQVRALNGTSAGPPSTPAQSATPQAALAAPHAPSLTKAEAGDSQVLLEWVPSSTGGAVATYTVERAVHTGSTVGAFTDLQTGLTGLTHTDTAAVNGTTYSYRVVAVNATSTATSNTLSATPQAPLAAPGAPNLTNAVAGNNQVALTWTPPTTGGAVATYTVERATHTGSTVGAFTDVQTGLTGLTHTDTTAVNGTTYSYRIVAVNATGSATSNVRSATPQAPGNNTGGGGGGGGGPITVPTPPPTTPPQVGRCVDLAPPSNFSDVPVGHMHGRAIDCIAWKGITVGTSPSTFSPGRVTTRAQMASFVARTIREAGVNLPAGRNKFTDDEGSVHQDAINQLAAAGIVVGKTSRRFDPDAPVRRDQMASMMIQTYGFIRDEQVAPGRDYFVDDNGNVHEENINAAAELGLTFGRGANRYAPASGTRRDQMAAFLARLLEALGA